MVEKQLLKIQVSRIINYVKKNKPLIHCLTNHITINDCANVILSIGGKAIMAEHPDEVEDITRNSNVLVINLGNINNERMVAIEVSAKIAIQKKIPIIIDVVGVNCSKLRLNYANKIIMNYNPTVIKGNMSEIKAILGQDTSSKCIDVSEEDKITKSTVEENIKIIKSGSKKLNSIILSTGEIDLISDGNRSYIIKNGCEQLSRTTGTGCMLNSIIGTFLSEKEFLIGTILGTALLGIAGEKASSDKGMGSFKIKLLDNISELDEVEILKNIKIEEVN